MERATHDLQGPHFIDIVKVADQKPHHVFAQGAAALVAKEGGEFPKVANHIRRCILTSVAVGGIVGKHLSLILAIDHLLDRLAGCPRLKHGEGHAKGKNGVGKAMGVAYAQPAVAHKRSHGVGIIRDGPHGFDLFATLEPPTQIRIDLADAPLQGGLSTATCLHLGARHDHAHTGEARGQGNKPGPMMGGAVKQEGIVSHHAWVASGVSELRKHRHLQTKLGVVHPFTGHAESR